VFIYEVRELSRRNKVDYSQTPALINLPSALNRALTHKVNADFSFDDGLYSPFGLGDVCCKIAIPQPVIVKVGKERRWR
jgi:hypothetical protein